MDEKTDHGSAALAYEQGLRVESATATLWQWDLEKVIGVKNRVLLTLPAPFLKS